MTGAGQRKPLSTGFFYMWRCLVAIGHADGSFGREERDYFFKTFDRLAAHFLISDAQAETLARDMDTPQPVAELLPQINDPDARGLLIHFGYLLAEADGKVSPEEEDILEKLQADHLPGLEVKKLRAEMQEGIARSRREHEKFVKNQRAEARARNPWFTIADALLLKLGVDVLG